jgi:hypothetical protein
VSEFVPGPAGGGARGPALCVTVDTCIDALDVARWCFDHEGCCGDLRCRTADGVCAPPDLGVTTGDGTTGTTGDAGTTGTTGETTTGTTTGTTGGSTSGTTAASTG